MTRLALVLFLCSLPTTSAVAYDRARLPDAVAVVQADAIVVAQIVEVLSARRWQTELRVRVLRSLKGTLEGEHVVALDGGPWKAGDTVVVHMVDKGGTWSALLDGAAQHTAAVETARVAAIHDAPAWSTPKQGWSNVLVVTAHDISATDHLDAWIVYRNTTASPATFRYREKPTSQATSWTLHATRSGTPVPSIPHPHVTPAESAAYFEQHGNVFETEVEAGSTFAMPITRINSAEPGWGYKQRQGFSYVPMKQPGTYSIVAEEHGAWGRPTLRTEPVVVRVR